ncbi:MAG: type II and III secretion system protein [Deltaproteobacteria bacterium]|nr:type II and III secretion system protein [Deltaproteobacteria bacterium]
MPKPRLHAAVLAIALSLAAGPAHAGGLDVEPSQIMIEVKIVETGRSELRDLGVRFGYYDAEPREADLFGPPTAIETLREQADPFGAGLILDADTSVDGIWLGGLPGFDLELSALEQSADTRVLAAPKILVTGGEGAEIRVGGRLPAFTTEDGQSFGGAMEFGLRLEVRPVVTPDDEVRMEIEPVIDRLVLPSNGAPRIETRTVRTTITLPDGGTLLLGGLFRDVDRDTATRVPMLGDVPILGRLFRSRAYQENRTELLIIVTPVIIREEDEGGGDTSSSSSSGGRKANTGTRPGGEQQRVHRPQVDPNLNQVPNVQRPGNRPGYNTNTKY